MCPQFQTTLPKGKRLPRNTFFPENDRGAFSSTRYNFTLYTLPPLPPTHVSSSSGEFQAATKLDPNVASSSTPSPALISLLTTKQVGYIRPLGIR